MVVLYCFVQTVGGLHREYQLCSAWPKPISGGLEGGIAVHRGGMARDRLVTFNNSKFKPYSSFKVKCVG